jgi:death-on-curing protein
MDLIFLTLDDVSEIHREMIARYGGSDGIRDKGLLESAVATPQASFGGDYVHTDIFEMAAAYLFHIVKNHPFIDGNKRAGAMAAFVFLKLNKLTLVADENQFERIVLSVAESKIEKRQIAEFFKKHCKKSR